eukprot:TRINITY_DN8860_c0_g1_i1.p1 TRINITY_DN8860_c0_g1~~TRINITY_DN8860_c0_g1_i1.p1  ORF type:complete len:250 (+),score=83.32 TRINITY_DN8860_c0_g1_i1:65-814(+)
MSFKRKLAALNYPTPDKFDPSTQAQYRGLVVWLEDQKIRHYKIDERASLRDIESDVWPGALHKYLSDLACPIMSGSPGEILDWLLGCAVRFEYGEKLEIYNKQTKETVKQSRTEQPKIVSNNPLDNLDFSTPEFKAGVEALAGSLQITKHPDHLVTLQAICKLVATRLNPKALSNPSSVVPQGEPYPFRDSGLGFETGDPVVNDAAKILRLLHIQDMRLLQTRINECIVAIQAVTANPKTDTRLGKVGR